MKPSQLGERFVKSFEKCRLVAYDDGVGVWTFAWGRTKGVHKGMTCTQEQADAWFAEEFSQFAAGVEHLLKVPVKQHQFDALVSFAYNVGLGALESSTLLRVLNAGNAAGSAMHFEDWNKGNVGGQLVVLDGLTKRRRAERQIFERGLYAMHDGPTVDGSEYPRFGDVVGDVA